MGVAETILFHIMAGMYSSFSSLTGACDSFKNNLLFGNLSVYLKIQ